MAGLRRVVVSGYMTRGGRISRAYVRGMNARAIIGSQGGGLRTLGTKRRSLSMYRELAGSRLQVTSQRVTAGSASLGMMERAYFPTPSSARRMMRLHTRLMTNGMRHPS